MVGFFVSPGITSKERGGGGETRVLLLSVYVRHLLYLYGIVDRDLSLR